MLVEDLHLPLTSVSREWSLCANVCISFENEERVSFTKWLFSLQFHLLSCVHVASLVLGPPSVLYLFYFLNIEFLRKGSENKKHLLNTKLKLIDIFIVFSERFPESYQVRLSQRFLPIFSRVRITSTPTQNTSSPGLRRTAATNMAGTLETRSSGDWQTAGFARVAIRH